ncbi:MAG TPA: hypothetical protein QGH10_10550 [Armatimonadota bacterium]|nr:hypothetical protein [Armatimonadota bacterium]
MKLSDRDIAHLRKQHWGRNRIVIDEITRDGFQCHLDSVPYSGGAFKLSDRHIRCIDGRVSGGGVRLAGSGIYLGLEGAKQFAEAAEATGVTYHRDCGAVARYAQEQAVAPDDAQRCGHEAAQALADALGLPCQEARLDRPAGFHDELVIYYDGTGRFDPDGCHFLPHGFVISRAYLDFHVQYAVWEVQLAISLALGESGFGDLFTPEKPLVIVAVAETPEQANALHGEIASVPAAYAGRVVIDGMLADA